MKPRTLIFTGEGKGKTTAAFGMALRAAGHGQRILVIQFLKSYANTGEIRACASLPGVEAVQMGAGFVPAPAHPDYAQHQAKAREALTFARRSVESGMYDLIILDEICGAIGRGLLEEKAVVELLNAPKRTACLVLTGRHATENLILQADTVTEMRCIRHGYTQGIEAQKGVEF
jgi:cob(I)alamin adenosyltransferase